jgi:hypothetical protein
MTGLTFAPSVAVAGVFGVAGLGFGLAYFAALRRTADGFAAGGGWLLTAALTLGRFAAVIPFFGFVAKLGALPLLLAFIGFLIARAFVFRAVRRAG